MHRTAIIATVSLLPALLTGCGGPSLPFPGDVTSSAALPEQHDEPAFRPAAYETYRSGQSAAGEYLLDAGDRLRIFVYGQPNLSRMYVVDQSGTISVPLIGTVTARGLTTRRLAGSIRARLASSLVRDPQVTVDIQQARPFFILGEVRSAGQYPYVAGMTVETAVAIAGGYSERASDRSFRITRRNGGYAEQIEADADFALEPGDTIFVHERLF